MLQEKHVIPTLHHEVLQTLRHPSQELYVIGITGTNGKTTVSYLIGNALNDAGFNAFVLGTLNSGSQELTTPVAKDIERIMRDHVQNGGTHFVMEVSSEGIVEERIEDIEFDIKILTNITPDHLDYHKTFESYRNAKMQFMNSGSAHKIFPDEFENITLDFETQLVGDFNQLNIKTALTALRHIGVSEKQIQQSLSSCQPPRGRLEPVDEGQAFSVFIDYAHSADSLEKVLNALKPITLKKGGRLLVLFGCGGNRDKSKRPKMGKVASQLVDFMILTDDNPRFEESQEIINDIIAGIESHFSRYLVIYNRREAIREIIRQAKNDDIILIAGRGHEKYQIIKNEHHIFDDHQEASLALSRL